MTLSSRRGAVCGLVDRVIAEHGPQDVEPAMGQGDDGLGVGFAYGSFAVVEGAGGGIVADRDLGGQLARPQQAPVVAAGSFEVAVDAAGVTRYRGQTGDTGEAVHGVERVYVAAGGGEELGAQSDAEAGHAQDDLGVAVAAKSVLDERFDVSNFGVEGHHLLG